MPVRTEISENFLRDANSRLYIETLPPQVRHELRRANRFFDRVEVWGKRRIEKDPIAVGYQGNGGYLIARWGMAKLAPFEAMKKKHACDGCMEVQCRRFRSAGKFGWAEYPDI